MKLVILSVATMAAFVTLAVQRSIVDIAAAQDPGDPTNGGFWTVSRTDIAVDDAAKSASNVDVRPVARSTKSISELEARDFMTMESLGCNLDTGRTGLIIVVR